MGPETEFSQYIHALKYRGEGETFNEAANRWAATLRDNDAHFRALKEVLAGMRFLPAGRIQAGAGSSKNVTAMNCLAGEVKILTREYGSIEIEKVAGQEVTLLDGNGDWVKCPIYCHGLQDTYETTFKGGSESKVLRSTLEHSWVYQNGLQFFKTKSLFEGSSKREVHFLAPKKDITDETDYRKGVQHGIIYADGSRHSNNENASYMRICSDAEEILPWFDEFPISYSPSCKGDPTVYIKGIHDLKAFPDVQKHSLDYLLGFIRGWIAADGCASTQPTLTLCGDESEYAWLSRYAPLVGIQMQGFSTLAEETNLGKRNKISLNFHFKTNSISFDDILIQRTRDRWKHTCNRNWRAHGKAVNPRNELVYCPVVSTTHSFALPGGIHSGNCFVAPTISDSLYDGPDSITTVFAKAMKTLQMGGGIGYDFSTLRPRGALIKKLGSQSAGPIPFMKIFDAGCKCIASAGHRRGAQMGVLRIDHPDVKEFVRAKHNSTDLTAFNISVAVTDKFMRCLETGESFPLTFKGEVYKNVDAYELWELIMRSTYDWSEPGILFIDRVNEMNNLNYCETIAASNPSLPAGTKVHTKTGMFPIEHLEDKSFQVKSLDGTWQKANCFLSSPNAPLYEITGSGDQKIRCTAEHQWPVLLNGRYVKVRTDELVSGDWIPANRNERMGLSHRPDLSYKDGLVTGIVFGDGCYNIQDDDGGAYLSIHCNCKDIEIHEILGQYFHSTPRLQKEGDEVVINVTKDQKVRAWIKKVGLVCGNKCQLPMAVWYSNDDFIAGFIDGFISSNGYVTRLTAKNKSMSRIIVTSKHRTPLNEFRVLLAFHGILSTISDRIAKLDGKEFTCSDLKIAAGSIKRFAALFTLCCTRKQQTLDDICKLHFRYDQTTDHVLVKSVELLNTSEPVWDISVDYHQHTFQMEVCTTGNCAEQMLGPDSACLLGSFNLVKYLTHERTFDYEQFTRDIPIVVRAMDNVTDKTKYPLPEQEEMQKAKRRMGIGVTGLANTLETIGYVYGSKAFVEEFRKIMDVLVHGCYRASIELAKEKGPFPMFDAEKYCESEYLKQCVPTLIEDIRKYGIRNSHLISIAPTGTISLAADNISSSIEPVLAYKMERTVITEDNEPMQVVLEDYSHRVFGVNGKRVEDLSVDEHLAVLFEASFWSDSAVSKTCNVSDDVTWDQFKDIYYRAWKAGCKGCTTFRAAGKRKGILKSKDAEEEDKGAACRIDPETGRKVCDE